MGDVQMLVNGFVNKLKKRCVKPALEPCSCKNLVLGSCSLHSSSRHVKIINDDIDIDTISRLPDELLCDILSFLTTKEAVATCVLAKRWRHLFTWLPRLDIDDSPISDGMIHRRLNPRYPREKFASFREFVDNVLRTFQSQSISKFRLSFGKAREYVTYGNHRCYPRLRPKYLNVWLCFLVARGVRKLDLCVYVRKPGMVPPDIFRCQTLEFLKIDTNLGLECPIDVDLPNLKVLNLCLRCFPAGDAIARLVSSCQILEDLTLIGYYWRATNPINISAPFLRRLYINIIQPDHDPRNAFVLDTPNLEYLGYHDSVAVQYSIGDLNSLIEASIYFVFGYSCGDTATASISCIFKSMSNVQRLYLTRWLEDLENLEIKLHLPVFRNLNYLNLRFEGRICWHETLMELLNSSPNLETLVFEEITINSDIEPLYSETAELEAQFWRTVEDVPYCVQTHIKRLAINKYWGIEWELELVRYFLSKGLPLEELEIACEASMTMEDRESVESILQKLPRASLNCLIQVR